MYTIPVAFIVLKQQFPTRPDIDAIPDIIVIFAIFFFSFLFMVYYFVLFPAVFRGLSCSVPRPICRFVLFPAVFRGFLSSVPRH